MYCQLGYASIKHEIRPKYDKLIFSQAPSFSPPRGSTKLTNGALLTLTSDLTLPNKVNASSSAPRSQYRECYDILCHAPLCFSSLCILHVLVRFNLLYSNLPHVDYHWSCCWRNHSLDHCRHCWQDSSPPNTPATCYPDNVCVYNTQ